MVTVYPGTNFDTGDGVVIGSDKDNNGGAKIDIGRIVGGVVGGIVALAVLFFAWKVYKHRYPSPISTAAPANQSVAASPPVIVANAAAPIPRPPQPMSELDENGVPKNPPPYAPGPGGRSELENAGMRIDRTGRKLKELRSEMDSTDELC